MRELMSYLPENYPASRETVAFQEAVQPEVNTIWEVRDNLLAQLNPYRATWGLDYWEDALGLGACQGLPLDTRRRQVVAKLQGRDTTTPAVIQAVAETLLGFKVKVIEYFSEYRVELEVDSGGALPAGVPQLKERLREIMPSHLDWGLVLPTRNFIPIRLTPGPRAGRTAPPAYRARLGPGKIPAAAMLGTRYSIGYPWQAPPWGKIYPPGVFFQEVIILGYNVYMTRAGYALQAKLFAQGGELEITRVEVGSGVLPEGADWRNITALVESRAAATSTAPIRRDCTVSLEIEYRADLGGSEEPFQINEFGVFAVGAEGAEALILYGDLSDCPDTAVPLKYGGCVRRYPVLMEIGPDAGAKLDYPAGAWVTWDDLSEAVRAHDADPAAHPHLLGLYAGADARLSLLELMYNTDVSGNPYTATFESLTGLAVTGVWNTALARLEF